MYKDREEYEEVKEPKVDLPSLLLEIGRAQCYESRTAAHRVLNHLQPICHARGIGTNLAC